MTMLAALAGFCGAEQVTCHSLLKHELSVFFRALALLI